MGIVSLVNCKRQGFVGGVDYIFYWTNYKVRQTFEYKALFFKS